MKRTDYRLLVFDWDGTLMNSAEKITTCLQQAIFMAGMAERSQQALQQIIGLGLREAFDCLYPTEDEAVIQKLMSAYREQYLHLDRTPVSLFNGVAAMLAILKDRRYRMAIATGKGRNGLNKVLHETGLKSFFAITRCAEETSSKPDTRMLCEIMQEAGVAKESVLMIGDTTFDLEMARRAGVDALGVKHGVHSVDQLNTWAPLAILDHVTHLLSWLDRR